MKVKKQIFAKHSITFNILFHIFFFCIIVRIDIPSTLGVNSTAEQLQEIRNRLRNSDSSQLSQVGMALDELADLADETIPRLRGVAQSLREEPTEDDVSVQKNVNYDENILKKGHSLISIDGYSLCQELYKE